MHVRASRLPVVIVLMGALASPHRYTPPPVEAPITVPPRVSPRARPSRRIKCGWVLPPVQNGGRTLPGDIDDVLHEEVVNRLHLAGALHLVLDRLHHVDLLLLVREEVFSFL